MNPIAFRRVLTCGIPLAILSALGLVLAAPGEKTAEPVAAKPLRALMITGGCCHDYEKQKMILSAGISQRAKVEWTVVHEGGTSRDHKVSIYSDPGWTEGYDVIVHNECFGAVKDDAFVEALAKAHQTTPAVVLHCTMHSYRSATRGVEEWRRFLGVTSTNHGKHAPITMKNLKPEHPVMKGFPAEWTTPKGELYRIMAVGEQTVPLAEGIASPTEKHLCVWVNQYGPNRSRVFGTTIGHHNETMSENTYLDLVTRGLLWAAGQLSEDGTPKPGYEAP